ncbi:MAG: tRNA preQ1(34) S-adenosylmethionine ribosyltransferase-isomerase QueA [Opitutaceae bacterium]|nr:tRNA preQ1(34) S-adenosylmethionine ribosyltransferase-isomerase QueA [Opitutaceae bacterium]
MNPRNTTVLHVTPSLATHLFDYTLPTELIAQTPAAKRDQSRLLVVDRVHRTVAHHVFSDLPEFLRPGDCLIRNSAAVLPARLFARRAGGGACECFLLRPTTEENTWWCLLRPGKKLPAGAHFARDGGFTATVLEKDSEGCARVHFSTEDNESIVATANRLGAVPLPPYIERKDPEGDSRTADLDRYQTVYARHDQQVAVAAPTAGLHFTPELLTALHKADVLTRDVILHVGLGTFKPIATPTVQEHAIHRERYEMPPETQALLCNPSTGRRIAVGTTSVRCIEDFLDKHPEPPPPPLMTFSSEASLFIYPPRNFRGVDALITNFHQPCSTLLCLVAAFLSPGSTDGIAFLHDIYRDAIARKYRFLSYGDAMLIL